MSDKMSRYSFDYETDPLQYLKELHGYPFYKFAVDLMHFVSQKSDLNWTPLDVMTDDEDRPRPKCYSPNAMSPFSVPVQKIVEQMFRHNTRDFVKIYDKLVAESTGGLVTFLVKIRKVLSNLDRVGGTPYEMLRRLFYVAKLAAVFYERGSSSAADLAVFNIAFALRKINKGKLAEEWFESIYSICKYVLRLYEEDPEAAITIYMSSEVDELDSDEECSDSMEKENRTVAQEADKKEEDDDRTCGERSEEGEKNEIQEKNPETAVEKLIEKLCEMGEKLDDSSVVDESSTRADESSSD